MDAAEAWLPARMRRSRSGCGDWPEGHGEALAADAEATLAAGGKRLRPMLVLLCAGPGAGEAAIRAATAVELVHMATLVHDDVLDAAPLRRGRPTVVARSGRARRGRRRRPAVLARLRRARTERHRGGRSSCCQGLGGPGPRGARAAPRRLRPLDLARSATCERCGLKTARLFECACLIGRVAPEASDEPPGALRDFGREIGLAFQLLDDVLDVTGPPERTGKARGTDLLDGTVTLPLILARERDPSLAKLDLRGLDPAGAEALCDRIAATGVLEEVRAGARRRVGAAKRALERLGRSSAEQRELLELVADGVVERYS